jgi:CRP-like cAMP-binding protein
MIQFRGDLHENHLLGALPSEEWQVLAPHLELVRLQRGQVLADPGQRITHVYFPTTAIISMLYTMENGASVEIAAVGNEGVLGVPVLTGGETMPSRAQVQAAGFAYRMSASILKQQFNNSDFVHRLMLLYMQALMTQIAQTAACNRHHSLSKQLCRWLLLSIDRLDSNELLVTQETIANMLGVRREGITEAAGKLAEEGMIHHSRGHITVLDRAGLEGKACECYGIVRKEFDRLLPRLARQREMIN